jgi:WD40 repeat protein
VYVWDTAAIRHERTRITLPARLASWSFAGNGDSVVTAAFAGQVTRWHGTDFQEEQPLIELGANTVGIGVCFSPDGRLLAAGSTNGLVQVYDLEKRAVLKELRGPPVRMLPIVFSAQGHRLTVVHPDDGTFHFWDLVEGNETGSSSIANVPSPSAGAFSPDERCCLGFTWGGGDWLVEMATGRRVAPNLNLRQVSDVSFSPDGKLVAAASELGLVRLWETASWQEVTTLRGVLMGCHSVAFSPDRRRLAAGSSGREAVKLWDTTSYQEVLTLEGQGSPFNRTAFSPDGNVLGSRSGPGILHLWRAPPLAEIDAANAQPGQDWRDVRPQDARASASPHD